MKIGKTASKDNFRRQYYFFASARNAFKSFLKSLNLHPAEKILLPSYIGWSSREGSGIFDPVQELNIPYRFYNLTENLDIDPNHINELISNDSKIKVLLLVHYFGFPDKQFAQIAFKAKSKGIIVIEDEAHSLYSDLIGGICGRVGDASFFSLHKMLPINYGGMLMLNDQKPACNHEFLSHTAIQDENLQPFRYDIKKIAEARIINAEKIYRRLKNEESYFGLIKPLEKGICPQTVPVIIKNGKRDHLYFKLNELGFGVVSLYHTLINQISEKEFSVTHGISKQILNLPVHQDIAEEDMNIFLDTLIREVKT